MPTPTADGPDISHYQTLTGKPIDPAWFLFSHKCSEGASSGDAKFVGRWAWARAQGFRYRGAYHWLRSDSSVRAQAENFVRRIAGAGGLDRGEFVQLDWETTPNIPLSTSLHAAEWADRIEQTIGRRCVITYTGTWLPDSTLDADTRREFLEWRDENPDAPLWLAYYNTSSGGGWAACAEYAADVWQYTSRHHHPSIVSINAAGVDTGFDMNHVFSRDTLDVLTDQVPAPAPAPPEETDEMRIIILDKRLQGAGYFADTLAPVGGDVVAAALADPEHFKVLEQDHEVTTLAAQYRNGPDVALEWEKFRDARDGVAD